MGTVKFNELVDHLPASASIELMAKSKELKEQGLDIVSFAGGEPDFDTPSPIVNEVKRALDSGFTHYTTGKGLPELQVKIAEKLKEENALNYESGGIIVTPGAKYAVYLAIRTLINPGDEVIILDPSWVSYDPIVRASGGRPVHVGLRYEEDYRIDADRLEAACSNRTKAIVINYPNNPTGRILTEEGEQTLLRFAEKHRNVCIIADEIYERIIFDGKENISIGRNTEISDRVITVNGFSKSLAMTGWRVGYVAASKEISDVMYHLFQHSITTVSGFIQKAAVTALDCKEEIGRMRKKYEERRNYFVGGLNSIPGVECAAPQGTFYAWTKIKYKQMNSFELCRYLLDNGVVAVPGEEYGLGAAGCVRMSFAASDEMLQKGIARIRTAIQNELGKEVRVYGCGL